jgi:hypothetical protein
MQHVDVAMHNIVSGFAGAKIQSFRVEAPLLSDAGSSGALATRFALSAQEAARREPAIIGLPARPLATATAMAANRGGRPKAGA